MSKLSLIILLFITSGCYLANPLPENPSYWQYGLPAEEEMDQELLLLINQEIKSGQYENIKALVVVRNDKLVFENYYAASNRKELFDADRISLTISQLAIGIAIEEGLIISVETPIIDLLPISYVSLLQSEPRKSEISLFHLMTHSSGLAWNEGILTSLSSNNDINIMRDQMDYTRYQLEKQLEAPPGFRTTFNSGTGVILSAVIQHVSGQTLEEYVKTRLFEPLQINEYTWQADGSGTTDGSAGLFLSALNLTKIGYLLNQGGHWNGKQLVSADWISKATDMQTQITNTFGYGYYFWKFTDQYVISNLQLETNDLSLISGAEGTSLFMLPHAQLTVMIVADTPLYGIFDPSFFLFRRVIQAIIP
ncbi:MAG: CubicO group peptidase (beta-lactamase class C family) [Cyclobacteriaceae bacterium]